MAELIPHPNEVSGVGQKGASSEKRICGVDVVKSVDILERGLYRARR
jgi:hypothetical protein